MLESQRHAYEGARTCRLTDLELSGAPQLATREADRARPTRPLERLVSWHVANASLAK